MTPTAQPEGPTDRDLYAAFRGTLFEQEGSTQTLKRNENRCSRPSSVVVGDSRRMRSDLRLCADPAVGRRWRRTVSAGLLADCLRTAGQVERHVRAAANSVRATCSAFSVAAAPTGFAS